MAKMKSTLSNMLLSLTLIALVAAGLLAGVYTMTKATIDATNAAKQQAAIIAVLPQQEGLEIAEPIMHEGMEIYCATLDGQTAGAAVKVAENGFGGTFNLMVGFDAEGAITGFQVLDHQETPGLGSKMQEWFANPQVIGQKVGETNFTVSKDGGDVDAITAATISSRAFLLAVTKAYNAFMSAPAADAASGATVMAEENETENETVEE
ncbi:MAG: RnfABCDGE type electron transport complex subunit G [Bacteroidales bacterium]|nr:RnfABCDGE type electron transport complex subunit G [Candidatus Colicola faecequi]